MLQISYNILYELSKKNNHIRGLAKALNTNQTTIARKVKEWEEKNVLDHSFEGKNKTYFIKKTIEAEEHIKILEHLKLVEAINKYPELREITKEIRNNEVPLAIIFGSYAKRLATRQSDIDLYLYTEDRKLKKKLELLNSKLSIKIGEFNKENLLIKEIIQNHIIIKGVEAYYELVH